jgi:hypothetical protein
MDGNHLGQEFHVYLDERLPGIPRQPNPDRLHLPYLHTSEGDWRTDLQSVDRIGEEAHDGKTLFKDRIAPEEEDA